MHEIQKRKHAYWDTAFPGLTNLVLIKVVPERIDVINSKRGRGWQPGNLACAGRRVHDDSHGYKRTLK